MEPISLFRCIPPNFIMDPLIVTVSNRTPASVLSDGVSHKSCANRPIRRPLVTILLATFNGALWLDEQLQSIVCQTGVDVSVVASDDSSTDATMQRLADWSTRVRLQVLPQPVRRFGSAHRNFLRLICDAPLGNAEYVALADQDDIWLDGKLERAVQCLRDLGSDAYSSNVTAFWPDGRRLLINKSQPQCAHDFLFGSPGPGCTFVMPRQVFDQMREWVRVGFDQMQGIWVHDWLIYAYVRGHGLSWHIDNWPSLLYRQHGNNEIGVNSGWRATLRRWRHLRSGKYRRDILAIAEAVGDISPLVSAVRRLALADRLWLIVRVRHFRRRSLECLVLAFFFLLMPGDRNA